MAKYYAWSNFRLADEKDGTVTTALRVGDEVTQAKLAIEDEEFEYLLETGAVREQPYPDMPDGDTRSPAKFMTDQVARAAAGELTTKEYKALQESGMVFDTTKVEEVPSATVNK